MTIPAAVPVDLPGSATVIMDQSVAVAGPVTVDLDLDLALALAGALTMDVTGPVTVHLDLAGGLTVMGAPRVFEEFSLLGGLAPDPVGEHAHERRDLLGRARPVLGRERVHRELPDPELGGVSQARLDRVGLGVVALDDR